MSGMIKFVHNLGHHTRVPSDTDRLILDYDQRVKGRLRAKTEQGHDVGLFLERGKVLLEGDVLESEEGERVVVSAAEEALIEARCEDWMLFSRCCYHLGNRHVPIEIGQRQLRFRPDEILRDMLHQLGATTQDLKAPFNPESGAYAGGHHHHHHHD